MTNRNMSHGRVVTRVARWSLLGYEGETHYRTVLAAALSASAILLGAAVMMERLLSV